MKGIVTLDIINVRTQELKDRQVISNLILTSMYPKLLALVGSDTTQYIDRMQFGSGTLETAEDQTQLQVPITPIKSVTSVVEPTDYSITFSAFLAPDEGNGFPVSEAGLITADNTLVARTTFSARTKTSSYQFGFTWTILLKS